MIELIEQRVLVFRLDDLEFEVVNFEEDGILYDWDNAEIIDKKITFKNGLIDIKLHCRSDIFVDHNLVGEIEFIILIDGVAPTELEGKFYKQFTNEIQFKAYSEKYNIYKKLIENFFDRGWEFSIEKEVKDSTIQPVSISKF